MKTTSVKDFSAAGTGFKVQLLQMLDIDRWKAVDRMKGLYYSGNRSALVRFRMSQDPSDSSVLIFTYDGRYDEDVLRRELHALLAGMGMQLPIDTEPSITRAKRPARKSGPRPQAADNAA